MGSLACADHRRSVLTWRPRQPTTGVSWATASTVSAGYQMPWALSVMPPTYSTAPPKPDRIGQLRPLELPGIAGGQPIFRQLVLPAVADLLLEESVVVTDAVAEGGYAEARHGVHEAGRQPSETAVSERGIRLQRAKLVEIDAQARKCVAHRLDHVEVGQCVEQQAANEIFDRQIADLLRRHGIGTAASVHPTVDDAIPHGQRGGEKPVMRPGARWVSADRIGELSEQRRAKFLDLVGIPLRPQLI